MGDDLLHLVPWLDAATAVPLRGGWTSETYELGGGWIVQIARTSYAANTLRHQLRVLDRLAPHFGVKIPKPQLACDGPVTIVYRKIEGTPCTADLPGAWPEQLGGLLARLHGTAPKIAGIASLGAETLREDRRVDCTRLHAAVAPHLGDDERFRAELVLADLLGDDRNWKFGPVVVHGDLRPQHVLVGTAGDLIGVIDWGNVGAGDPADDLAWWLHAMPGIGTRMLAAYGPVDDRFHERAKTLYAVMPWYDVERGIATADAALIESSLDATRARLT